MNFQPSQRRAFTLLEVALASVIGAIVLMAALSLVMTLERTQRTVSTRANESAQLQRARLVMQRAFGSILVSAPAPTRTTVATAVATDATTPAAAASGQDVSRELDASTRGRRAPGEAAQRGPGDARGSASAAGTASQGSSDAKSSGSADGNPLQPMIRPPDDAPPRIILHHDELVSPYTMTLKEADGIVLAIAPQRLELVLIEPPVPTQQHDAFVLARAVRLETQRRGISHERVEEEEAEIIGEPTVPEVPAEEGADAEPSEDWGIRAVRGAFELIPKEDKQGRLMLDDLGNPKAWELWWVPLAPRHTIEEVREMGRARAILEASSYGEPFRIATDLASCRFRMFDDRIRKEEFQATIQNQLPAYVEVDIATIGGLSASWLFEISWATGPETRPRVEDTASGETINGRSVENLPAGDGKGNPSSPMPPITSPAQPSNPKSPASTPRTSPSRGPYRVQPAVPIAPKEGRR